MRQLLVQFAGGLAIFVAIVHAIISETRVFASATLEPPHWRRLIHLVWHVSTFDWITYGILLIAATMLMSGSALTGVTLGGVAIYGFAAAGNAIAVRGRLHPGWILMSIVVALLLASLAV